MERQRLKILVLGKLMYIHVLDKKKFFLEWIPLVATQNPYMKFIDKMSATNRIKLIIR